MKKKCAVFTIVKNENYFLPIWLKYYQQYFLDADIYVLDHQSDDGSTSNLSVNVIPIINELVFDHQWLLTIVQNFQESLLQKYESVLFVESDELVYSIEKPLNEIIDTFLNDNEVRYQTCTGYEVIQDLETEKSLETDNEIFKNRNYWFKTTVYDKTLLSKIPLKWVWGFHEITNGNTDRKHNLFLCHLHRVDFEIMYKRNVRRLVGAKIKDDSGSCQNKIMQRDDLMSYFLLENANKNLIPEEHKLALNGI
jgi:hypothetical protein